MDDWLSIYDYYEDMVAALTAQICNCTMQNDEFKDCQGPLLLKRKELI